MISCTELQDSQSIVENAFRLLSLEPLKVLDSDLVEKEIYKSYHLFATDAHGIFGTATLSQRPLHTLPDELKQTLDPQDDNSYYELSLIHAKVPSGLDDLLQRDDLATRYYQLFYRELYEFLKTELNNATLVVTTTDDEAKNIADFGAWSFRTYLYKKGSFQGLISFRAPDKTLWDQIPLQSTAEKGIELL